ncbi:MAG TPA: hypothetical protein VGQ39_21435 [Pyrinomonadaceae bacterium]|nr:hypothetical protein [Pyrinomonadaceae bacterium]
MILQFIMSKKYRVHALVTLVVLAVIAMACSKLRSEKPLMWHLVLQVDPATPDLEGVVANTVAIIERRLDLVGVRDFKVTIQQPVSSGRIEVNLPSMGDPQRMREFLTAGGKLEIVHVIGSPNPAPPSTYDNEVAANTVAKNVANARVLPYSRMPEEKKWAVVEVPSIIQGTDLRNANAFPAADRGDGYHIGFTLKPDGASKLSSWTAANMNQYVGVVLNNELRSIAFIKSQISDSGVISGRFTKQSAEDLAHILNSGALPAPVRIIEERNN